MTMAADPATRIMYHRDGTYMGHLAVPASGGIDDTPRVWTTVVTLASVFGALSAQAMNGNSPLDFTGTHGAPAPSASTAVLWIFPREMDLSHIWVASSENPIADRYIVEWSDDTTDGLDGTWHAATGFKYSNAVPKGLSPQIALNDPTNTRALPGEMTGVVGLRVYGWSNGDRLNIHLYGTPTNGYEDELVIWDADDDNEIDLADLFHQEVLNGTGSLQFRVKNASATKDATGIQVHLTNEGSGSRSSTYPFKNMGSLDNGTDPSADDVDIDDLSPGEISPVITYAWSLDDPELPAGPHEVLIYAQATAFV